MLFPSGRVRGITETEGKSDVAPVYQKTFTTTTISHWHCSSPLPAAQWDCGCKYAELHNYVSVMKGFSSFVVWVQVLYYSTQVFTAAGVKDGDIATVVVVATLVVFTLITVRRHTLLSGTPLS